MVPGRLTPRLALALAACLLVPAAAAADAHETEGRLLMPGGVAMSGTVDLQGAGLIELERSAGDAGARMDFTGLANGVLVDRTRDKIRLGLPGAYEPSVTSPEETTAVIAADGAGRIENVRCGNQCQIALSAADGQGLLGARGPMNGTLQPTAQERVFSTPRSPQGWYLSSYWSYGVPAGAVEVEAPRSTELAPWASGRVTLVIVDAEFDLVAGDARRTVDARWWNETTQEAAGQPVKVRHHARYANLTLDGAGLALAPGAPFRLSLPAGANVRLEGVLASRDASGMLAVAGNGHHLDHDSLTLEGSLSAQLVGVPPGLLGDAPAFDVGFEGEATRAVVSGASVVPRLSVSAAEAGGGALALVGLGVLGRLFLAPLYHRLGPSDVLANPNRLRIYDAIRKRPGVDVGALVASVGLSRVLVRHHLRMLEAHKLIRATVWRRRRTYALAGEGSGKAACELKDPTRRRVASAVARSGGATQKDLAHALGLSQRLVSYHLGCLEGSSLVRAQGRNPRVYFATGTLAHALQKEEALDRAQEKGDPLAHGLEKEGEGSVADIATTA